MYIRYIKHIYVYITLCMIIQTTPVKLKSADTQNNNMQHSSFCKRSERPGGAAPTKKQPMVLKHIYCKLQLKRRLF